MNQEVNLGIVLNDNQELKENFGIVFLDVFSSRVNMLLSTESYTGFNEPVTKYIIENGGIFKFPDFYFVEDIYNSFFYGCEGVPGLNHIIQVDEEIIPICKNYFKTRLLKVLEKCEGLSLLIEKGAEIFIRNNVLDCKDGVIYFLASVDQVFKYIDGIDDIGKFLDFNNEYSSIDISIRFFMLRKGYIDYLSVGNIRGVILFLMKYCHEKFVNFIKDKLSENGASIDPKEIKKLVRRKNKTIFRGNVTYNLLFTCIVGTLSSDEISKEDYVKFFRYLGIEFGE